MKLEIVVIPVSAQGLYLIVSDIEAALRRAGVAHGEHEKRTGGKHGENGSDWYAEYLVREQAGTELPL
jgi:hypothetical protein